ncbi:MAG: FtsQ-type POTRA domain-containing protein [Alphaproteobacteria bacterium]|nr:FtsQ-type POTRA domain-containing protein [Alphaproteobacteria bacterium]
MSGVKRKPRAKAAPPEPPRMLDRPGKWKLIWKRQRQILRRTLAGVVLLAVLGLAGLAAQAIGQGASVGERLADATGQLGLRVQEIRIEGRQKTPEPLLRAAIGVRTGDPILGMSVRDAKGRIESIAWVQSATVERRLPGLIVVQIVERRPFAVWYLDGKKSLIDRQGEKVDDSDVSTFEGELPMVAGLGAPKAAAAFLDILATQPEIQARVFAAVRIGERRWNLRMQNGTDILLPEGAEKLALDKLAALQASHSLLDRPLQAVDLRLPDRLVIRPAVEKTAVARKPS